MAEFVMLICGDEKALAALPEEERAATFGKVGAWWAEQEAAGRIMRERGHRLQPSHTARTVRFNGSGATVTDGPFAETREVLGGYGIIIAPDIDAAVAVAKSWPGDASTIEVRPVYPPMG